jgi:acyl carrier protein
LTNDQELLEKVRHAFHASFGTDPETVVPGAGPDDIPGWDSLGHAVLTTSLEEALGASFDIDELMAMEDVSAILRIAAGKLAGAPS